MSETWDAWSIRKSEQAERLKAATPGLRIDNSGDYETRWLAIADRGEHVSVVVFGQTDICGRREIDATDDEVFAAFATESPVASDRLKSSGPGVLPIRG